MRARIPLPVVADADRDEDASASGVITAHITAERRNLWRVTVSARWAALRLHCMAVTICRRVCMCACLNISAHSNAATAAAAAGGCVVSSDWLMYYRLPASSSSSTRSHASRRHHRHFWTVSTRSLHSDVHPWPDTAWVMSSASPALRRNGKMTPYLDVGHSFLLLLLLLCCTTSKYRWSTSVQIFSNDTH